MKKHSILIILSFLISHFGYSQITPEVDSRKIIEKGIELHDEKKYTDAIVEFKKVPRNDTNFVLASLQLANSYIADKKDSLAVEVCNTIMDIPTSFAPNVLLMKGNALDNMKKGDEAIKVYEEGLKKFPKNNLFYYELGVLKYGQEKYLEAHDYYIKSIRNNPYHAKSHLQMGVLALKQGKLVPAILALQYYLLLDNSSEKAKSVVSELERIAKNEVDMTDIVKVEGLSDQDDFSEVESLVKSKIALTSKYKSTINLNFNITRQLQLMLEKLVVDKNDKGFYMQYYAPLFSELYKNNYFEPYAYSILSGMENKEVDSWVKKNTAKIDKMSAWIVDYLAVNHCTFETMLDGKLVKARHWFGSGKIVAVGNQNEKKENIGYWNYYYGNGILKSEGLFNNDKREGAWKFYTSTGVIKNIENYTNGNVTGVKEQFYTNGSIKSHYNYSNNLLDGVQILYYPTGVEKTYYEYKNDKQNGKEKFHYGNGKLKYELQSIDDKYQGELIQYYSSGHLMEKSTFKDNLRVGKYVDYYNLPENAIKSEGVYEKGVSVGEWKTYHQNGKIESIGVLNKEGYRNGVWKNYYDDGTIRSEEDYSNGKSDGSSKFYTQAGKLVEEFIYKNDILQEYKAYDSEGKIIYQNKKGGKNNYDVTLYYENGNKKRTGKVTAGKLDGLWTDYNYNGYKVSEENYTDGKRNGKTTYYYENGKVKNETDYVDGETNGFYRQYFIDGKVEREGAYINDKAIGVWKRYYANGAMEAETFYNDGDLDGLQKYYAVNGKIDAEEFIELGYLKKKIVYDTMGKVFQTINFDKGTGEMELKYFNGSIKRKTSFKKDYIQGVSTSYFPNGKVIEAKNFVDGNIIGEVKLYHPSGKLFWHFNFVNDEKHGEQIQYFENGGVKWKQEYYYGSETGKSTIYHTSGKVERAYTYKDGKAEGKSQFYAETGELAIERVFLNDYILNYTYEDKNGALVASIPVVNETGTIKAFYKNGNPSVEYTIKNGALEGKRLFYFFDGKIQSEEYYVCGNRNGLHKYFYASGKIKAEENWINGDRVGKTTTYHENGKVKSEEYYLNGNAHGTFKYYDNTGKLTHTYVYYNDDLIEMK